MTIATGARLRVTDLEGGQVVDMAVFNAQNPREKLSLPYSRSRYGPQQGQTFHPGDKLLAGDVLRSTIYRPMMRIVEETPEPKGVHGVDGRMCNRHLYEAYGHAAPGTAARRSSPPPSRRTGSSPRTSPTAWTCSWTITTTAPRGAG